MKLFAYQISLALLTCMACLPLKAPYFISDMVSFFLRYVIKYRRMVVRKNLRLAFPHKTVSELRDIEKGFYQHLGDCLVETVKLLHVSNRTLQKRIQVENTELINKLAQDNHSFIILLGHYGNWEWVQEVTHHYTRPSINAEIYHPAKNEVFDRIMVKIRSRFNTIQIPQNRAIKTLLRYQEQGSQFLVGFISDQRPDSSHLHHWETFLLQDTPYVVGGEDLGMRINAHFIYLDIQKKQRGHYVFTFKQLEPCKDEKPHPYTRAFLRMLEDTITRDPKYWLWSHDRWKFKRTLQTL